MRQCLGQYALCPLMSWHVSDHLAQSSTLAPPGSLLPPPIAFIHDARLNPSRHLSHNNGSGMSTAGHQFTHLALTVLHEFLVIGNCCGPSPRLLSVSSNDAHLTLGWS
jgi:hypothetical protein